MTKHAGHSHERARAIWRFAESEEDGETWLRNPALLQGYVDYESRSDDGNRIWRRIMVVTKGWLESQVQSVRKGTTSPLWIALPALVVLPDATGEELKAAVDAVIGQGGLDPYSTALST